MTSYEEFTAEQDQANTLYAYTVDGVGYDDEGAAIQAALTAHSTGYTDQRSDEYILIRTV